MDRGDYADRRFSRDEVGDLIETATRLDRLSSEGVTGEVSWAELRQIASELGISDEALLHAVAQRLEIDRAASEAEAEEHEKAEQRRKAWLGWRAHMASYVAVMIGLLMLDLVTGDGIDWFVYPAIGWGIAILIHTLTLLVTGGEEIEDDD